MQVWSEVRRRVLAGELSRRQAAAAYHLNFRTVQKILAQPEPQPLRQPVPRVKPAIGPFLSIIHEILDDDHLAPPKQRHTARRIYERLRDEHDYQGCASIVRAAVAAYRQSQSEVFVPLLHPPGEAQCDFGRAEVLVAGVRHKAALFVLTLPFSNARFGCLFPRECTEAFHAGHARAFTFFGGVPTRISYDNSKLAVTRFTGPNERRLNREFLRLQAHFAFAAHFCNVRQAHEKGPVEGGVGYVRRNFLVPVPQADCWETSTATWPRPAGGNGTAGRRTGRTPRPRCWPATARRSCRRRRSRSRRGASSGSRSTRCRWGASTATTTPCRPAMPTSP